MSWNMAGSVFRAPRRWDHYERPHNDSPPFTQDNRQSPTANRLGCRRWWEVGEVASGPHRDTPEGGASCTRSALKVVHNAPIGRPSWCVMHHLDRCKWCTMHHPQSVTTTGARERVHLPQDGNHSPPKDSVGHRSGRSGRANQLSAERVVIPTCTTRSGPCNPAEKPTVRNGLAELGENMKEVPYPA